MEPTDNLSGGHSRSGDYGFPAGPFVQEQEEDLMSLPENLDAGHILPLDPMMPCIPFGDGPISPLGEMRSGDYGFPAGTFDQLEQEQYLMSPLSFPYESQSLPQPPAEGFDGENLDAGQILPLDEMQCIPAAAAEETNYAAAPAAPLLATHGTEPGQFSANFSLSPTTSDQYDEEEVNQAMVPWQLLLHQPMAPDGLSNTTNGGPAAMSHADAVPLVVQQGTSTTADELPHPKQQLPIPNREAHQDLSLVHEEAQIQQMMPTILPSQLPSPTPVINLGPDEANRAVSALMASQGTLISAGPHDQVADIVRQVADIETRQVQRKLDGLMRPYFPQIFIELKGLINRYFFEFERRMEVHLRRLEKAVNDFVPISQLFRHSVRMMKEEIVVWQHFWRSQCTYCHTLNVICDYCNTFMRDPFTIELLRHLDSFHNTSYLEIKEIAENASGESEPIETDNINCATAARVEAQGINAVLSSPWQQHQLLMGHEEQMATILSSEPCCQGPPDLDQLYWPVRLMIKSISLDKPDSWWDLTIGLSDSSCGSSSSTNISAQDGFRLKFSNNKLMVFGWKAAGGLIKNTEKGCKIVHVHSSAAWVHFSENSYKDQGVLLETGSDTIGSSYLSVGVDDYDLLGYAPPLGCEYPWQSMHLLLHSLGFRKEFATNLVVYALGRVDECNSRLRSPRSSNKGKSIVEQACDMSSGKRKRKSAPRRWSEVWNHFTKVVVEAEGSMVTMAKCNYCPSELKADSAGYGTSHLARHIRTRHPEHGKSL